MKKMLLIAILLISAIANAEPSNPVDELLSTGSYHMQACAMELSISRSQRITSPTAPSDNVSTCFTNARTEMKSKFEAASKYATKKKKNTKTIKNYYIAWQSAFNGMIKNPSSTDAQHDAKQAINESKLEEAKGEISLAFNL